MLLFFFLTHNFSGKLSQYFFVKHLRCRKRLKPLLSCQIRSLFFRHHECLPLKCITYDCFVEVSPFPLESCPQEHSLFPIKELFLASVFVFTPVLGHVVAAIQSYPLWGFCCYRARQSNRSILESGAMDNATPATTNNTRMEKRIALECGKRKPDEVVK